jgi:OOP family OmpA-OmpF porin
MFKRNTLGLLTVLSAALVSACSSTPYQPVATKAEPIDVTAFAPKVESFVVLLDSSSSMRKDIQDRAKIETAQDLVASFNSAVPALDFNAGLVTFGQGMGRCRGQGTASEFYGMTSYNSADFAEALGSLQCAGGKTPMSKGIDATTGMLASQTGPVAVFIVSDFSGFGDIHAGSVETAVEKLKAQHGNNVCLHTVKVGDDPSGDEMISRITSVAGCDSAVQAGDITSAAAMGTYVTETLMAPLQYEKHTVSATALFDFNKSDLKEQGKAELHNLGASIKQKGITVADIDVIGHTDSIGSETYNQGLSERRATAVSDYLVSQGIDGGIIDVSGKGESQPVASNDTDEGRALNRRVEVHVGTSRPMK